MIYVIINEPILRGNVMVDEKDQINGIDIEEYLAIQKTIELKSSLDLEHKLPAKSISRKNETVFDTSPGFVKTLCPTTKEIKMAPLGIFKDIVNTDVGVGKVIGTQLYTGIQYFLSWSQKCYQESDKTDITANNVYEYYVRMTKSSDNDKNLMSLSTFSSQISKIYKILNPVGVLVRSNDKPYYYDWNSEFWSHLEIDMVNLVTAFATYVNNFINKNINERMALKRADALKKKSLPSNNKKDEDVDIDDDKNTEILKKHNAQHEDVDFDGGMDKKLDIHYTSNMNLERIIENLPNGSRIKIVELNTNRIVDIEKN